MKTTKKLVAILLSIAMLLGIGATNAFAANIGDFITWTFDDGVYGLILFNGTVAEGSNAITGYDDEYDYCAYEFDATQAGYYFLSTDYYLEVADEYANDEAKDFASYEEMYYLDAEGEETYGYVYYFDAETVMIAVDSFYNDVTLDIEYLGDVSAVTLDEEDVDCLIFGHNAYNEEDSIYVEGADYSVTFANGKTLKSADWGFVLETNGAIATGENALKFDFLGYETEVIVGLYEITDFVESIELQKFDNHLNTRIYYDGAIEYFDLGDKPEYVIVNYTDGTSKTFEFYYGPSYTNNTITLPNGEEVYLYAWQTFEHDCGTTHFVAGMADHNFIDEPCVIEVASFSENFRYFSDNISNIIDYGMEDITYHVAEMMFALKYGFFEYFSYHFGELFAGDTLSWIFAEISAFAGFYLY